MRLTIDIETFSEENLKSAGLYRYAEHPSTDLLCVCWAFDDGPVSAWIPSADPEFASQISTSECYEVFIGPVVPTDLRLYIKKGGEVHAWNAAFERQVLNGPAGQRYGFPHITIEQTRCSMARSRHASMPGRLEDAANVLNADVKKRISGINAMRYLCKPRANGTRPTIIEERERFLQLVPYCAADVAAERAVDALLPELSPEELRVYHFDQRVNDRGVLVDLAAVADMECLINEYKEQLKNQCMVLTGISPSKPGPLSEWIRSHGFAQLENLQADTVRQVIERTDVPENIKTVLKLYSTYGMKAVAKYPAIRKAVCADGRIRGMLMYYGAGTGRWSSFIVQIHNLFRPVIDDPEIAIEAARLRDLDWLRTLYPGVDPMKIFASCVRGMLIAAPGKEFVFPDFSGIEARWNAWLFNEEWKLDAYRAYDRGEGPDLYVVAYARAFGVDPKTVTKAQRQIGKVLELALGYGGGVGAFVKMAASQRLDLSTLLNANIPGDVTSAAADSFAYAKEQGRVGKMDPDLWRVCEALKIMWRQAHPKIVQGWKDLEECSKLAVENPGKVYSVAKGRIKFKVESQWLVMRLPSGRKVRYFQPRITDGKLCYEGVDTVTRQWGSTSTYGGKLCENESQAGCRDLLVGAMLRFEATQIPVVMHVHDEPVLEVPLGALSDSEVDVTMCCAPDWAEGFPIDTEGHRGHRYRK
jgi:DNA polymerase bacteriophage-type